MQRYFNKKLGTEVIPSIHKITADCVELPDDHFFWHQLPFGKKIDFDADGMPILVSDPGPDVDARISTERAWRNAEIAKVAVWLDQIRNDQYFGSNSFGLPYTGEQLNNYRLALCDYPARDGFPDCGRPSVEDFA